VADVRTDQIHDWPSFHSVFFAALSFANYYGWNRDAFKEILSVPQAPDVGVDVPAHGLLVLRLTESGISFRRRCPDQYEFLIEVTAMLNKEALRDPEEAQERGPALIRQSLLATRESRFAFRRRLERQRTGSFGGMAATESVGGVVLRDEVLAVFGSDQVSSIEPLRPRPLGATVGVWRVRVADSSAVLKLLRLGAGSNINWAASPEPDHPRWWRRELVVLRDDLVGVLRPQLRPPTLLHAAERPDGSVALWLEDLGQPTAWTIEALARVARLLGIAQRRAAARLPTALPRDFLRAYLEPRIAHLAEPFASSREVILARLDAAPQTLSHFDFHPANIFPADGAATVIDWAYCGCGPIGMDAGVLASDALADEVVPPDEASLLVDAVWEAYRDGLADEGLADAAAEVYALGTAMRYAWLPAWLAGEYGPKPDERRSRGVVAAHATFAERAIEYL
jgi:hypothetical protein